MFEYFVTVFSYFALLAMAVAFVWVLCKAFEFFIDERDPWK